ncbi:MAG TPA: universal stress protein [Roseiflexaceae bacterium]|nr:universal stress protein [Roseiflexaceae bacterium]
MSTGKVLIPVDGSTLSQMIIAHALRLLQPSTHQIILMRVTDLPEGLTAEPPRPVSLVWPVPMYASERDVELANHPIYASQTWANVSSMLEDELVPIVHKLQDAGFTVSVAVRFGDPVEEIACFVESEGVELVAMATHGRTGLGRLVMGSVAEGVLHRLQVPIILIRPFDHRFRDGINHPAALGEQAADTGVGK